MRVNLKINIKRLKLVLNSTLAPRYHPKSNFRLKFCGANSLTALSHLKAILIILTVSSFVAIVACAQRPRCDRRIAVNLFNILRLRFVGQLGEGAAIGPAKVCCWTDAAIMDRQGAIVLRDEFLNLRFYSPRIFVAAPATASMRLLGRPPAREPTVVPAADRTAAGSPGPSAKAAARLAGAATAPRRRSPPAPRRSERNSGRSAATASTRSPSRGHAASNAHTPRRCGALRSPGRSARPYPDSQASLSTGNCSSACYVSTRAWILGSGIWGD